MVIFFLTSFMMMGKISAFGMNINDIEELRAYVLTELSPFEKTEFTYSCRTFVEASNAFGMGKKSQEIREILQKRANNQLTEEEKQKWINLSDDELRDILSGYEEMVSGFVYDSTWILKTYNNKFRIDVHSNGKHLSSKHFMYIFDGKEGVVVHPEKKTINKNTYVNMAFMTSMYTGCFGGDLYRFSKNKVYDLVSFNPENRKLVIKSDVFPPYADHCTYILHDSNYAYWKRFDVVDEYEKILKRIICNDFIDISGMLIPSYVIEQTRSAKQKKLIDFRVYQLDNAVVNDCDFGNDHFMHPKSDEYEIKY